MNLKTAVTKKLPYWDSLLKQIGLSFSEIDWKKNLLQEYAVIVVNSFLGKEETKLILNYTENGGSILIDADYTGTIFNIRTKQVYIKYLFSAEKIFGYNLPLIDLYKMCRIASNANLLNNQNGSSAVSFFKIKSGNVIIIPGNLTSSVFDRRVIRKKFYSPINKFPSERVSNVSKGGVCNFIRSALEQLYHSRNLPFISLWNFPGDSKNIFLFRIDTDYGSVEEVELLYRTLKENNIKGTWFIETKSAENWIDKYSSFENQEIGLHCYRHRVFKSFKKNCDNFKKGINVLKKVSINPKGTAAPFGEWNDSFGKAAKEFGFEYSSEFSYSYDNLPHFPIHKNKLENILQVPIHPVSFGRLFHSGFNDDEMYDYFINVINNKLALCEPVIIYTHPKEKRYEILKRIFNFVNEMNLTKYTFNEYSNWWKDRDKINYSASFLNNELKVITEKYHQSIWLKIIYPDKQIFLTPFSGNEKIKMVLPDFKYNPGFQPDILRKYNFRMLKDDVLFEVRKRRL